jgi:hypothetical protein
VLRPVVWAETSRNSMRFFAGHGPTMMAFGQPAQNDITSHAERRRAVGLGNAHEYGSPHRVRQAVLGRVSTSEASWIELCRDDPPGRLYSSLKGYRDVACNVSTIFSPAAPERLPRSAPAAATAPHRPPPAAHPPSATHNFPRPGVSRSCDTSRPGRCAWRGTPAI